MDPERYGCSRNGTDTHRGVVFEPRVAMSVFVLGGRSGIGTESGGDVVLLLQSFVPGFQVVLIGGVIGGL